MNFNKIIYNKSKNISEDFDFNKVKHRNTDIDAMKNVLALKQAVSFFLNNHNIKCVLSPADDQKYYVYPQVRVNENITDQDEYRGVLYINGSDLVFEYIILTYFKEKDPDMIFAVLSDEMRIDKFIIKVLKRYNSDTCNLRLCVHDYKMANKLVNVLDISGDDNVYNIYSNITIFLHDKSEYLSNDSIDGDILNQYMDITKKLDKKFPDIKLQFIPVQIDLSSTYSLYIKNDNYFPFGIFNKPEDCLKYLESNGYSIPSRHYIKLYYKDFGDSWDLPYIEKNGRSYIGIVAITCNLVHHMRQEITSLYNVHNVMSAINNGNKKLNVFNVNHEKTMTINNLPIKAKYAYIGYINNIIMND